MIIKTGSPMLEVLTHYRPKIDASDVLERLQLRENSYFIVSTHVGANNKIGIFSKLQTL